jgi:hypothetical protein
MRRTALRRPSLWAEGRKCQSNVFTGRIFLAIRGSGRAAYGCGVVGEDRVRRAQFRWTQDMEALINPYVADLSPRLLWRVQGEWDVLGFEVVDGRHADYRPGSLI